MASKLTLIDISSGFKGTDIQTNFTSIEDEFDDTLSRTGKTPNQMESAIDMNSFEINNLGVPSNNQAAARLKDVLDQTTEDATSKPATAITVEDQQGFFASSNVEAALEDIGDGTFNPDGYSSLRSLDTSGLADGSVVYVRGRDSVGDGGDGRFRWDSSDLSTEVSNDEVTSSEGDGGVYVAPDSDKTGASGAWVRQFSGFADVRWWGVFGDGSTDVTTPLRVATDSDATGGDGASLFFPNGTYILTSQIRIGNRGQRWLGAGRDKTVIQAKSGSSPAALIQLEQKYIDIDGIRFDGNDAAATCVLFRSGGQSQLVDCETRNATKAGVTFDTEGDGKTGGNNNLARLINHDSRSNGTFGIHGIFNTNSDDSQGVELIHCSCTSNGSDGLRVADGNDSWRIVGGLYEANSGWGLFLVETDRGFTGTHHVILAPWVEGNTSGNIKGYGTTCEAQGVGHYGELAVESINGGEPPVRNRFINATFKVAQERNSATLGTHSDVCDVWRVAANGASGDVSRDSGHNLTETGGVKDRLDVNITNFNSAGPVEVSQRIEDVETLAGRGIVVGFWGATNTGQSDVINVFWKQNFGSGGSSEVTGSENISIPQNFSDGPTWVEIELPDVDGKTIGGGDDFFEIGFQFADADVPTGEYRIASPFLMTGKQRPAMHYDVSAHEEMKAVQRYYESGRARTTVINGSGGSVTDGISFSIPFATRKRAVPTITESDGGGSSNMSGNESVNITESEWIFQADADNATLCQADRDWTADARL